VVMLCDRQINWWQAGLLFVPFAVQLFVPHWRIEVAWAYLALAAIWGVHYRHHLIDLVPGRRAAPPPPSAGSGS